MLDNNGCILNILGSDDFKDTQFTQVHLQRNWEFVSEYHGSLSIWFCEQNNGLTNFL